MTSRARQVSLIGAVVLSLVSGGVSTAQDKPADQRLAEEMELLRERARAEKRLVIADALNLTEGEAKAFWPVYNAYQSDMITNYDKLLELLDQYARAYSSMTDATATKLLNEYLDLEAAYVTTLRSYVPRFRKVLPPIKVARLYQVENKMLALVNYDLARHIPLAK